jgi:pullulanase/glycogen debranching enzyme
VGLRFERSDQEHYFWYEVNPCDYPQTDGGYIDNLSTGYAPKFDDEIVRQLFISSAAWLAATCHVDGFRLDQTSSIHQYAVVHANGRTADKANAFGTKFLKQWARTMRLLRPNPNGRGLFRLGRDDPAQRERRRTRIRRHFVR